MQRAEAVFVNQGIDSRPGGPVPTTLFVVQARQATYAGGIDSSKFIPGLLKGLQIRALRLWDTAHLTHKFTLNTLTKHDQIKGKQQGSAKEHIKEGNFRMQKHSLQGEGRRAN
jgi:hypothetical protein